MFFIQFEVTPRADHPDSDEVAGAFVNCWIDASSVKKAKAIAKSHISKECWIVDTCEEAFEVDESFYDEDDPNRQYFDQAHADGAVYVFHTFPCEEKGE